MSAQVDGPTQFWSTWARTTSTTNKRSAGALKRRPAVARWLACCVQFGAVLGLASTLQAGPELNVTKSPVFVDMRVGDLQTFLGRSSDQQQKQVQDVASSLRDAASRSKDRIITLRPRDLAVSFDMLRSADKQLVRRLAENNGDAAAWYENRAAAFFESVVDTALKGNADIKLSVLGLPVEAHSSSASAAVATNARYADVIDSLSAFVTTRRMILSGSQVNELQTLKRTMPETFRLAGNRTIVFRTNNNWRSVTTSGVSTMSSTLNTDEKTRPNTNNTEVPPLPPGMQELLASVDNAGPLAELLGSWGQTDSQWDLVSSSTFQPPPDGMVDGADLAYMLGHWSEYYPDQEQPGDGGGEPNDPPPSDGGGNPPPDDGGDNNPPPPPPSGQVGAFTTLGGQYVIGSGISLPFSVASGATNVDNVVFQVWSFVSHTIEAPAPDYTSPYVYPGSALSNVTPGLAEVQAVVRDSNDNTIAVIKQQVEFVTSGGGGSNPPDDGGAGDPPPDDGGNNNPPPDDGGNNNPPPDDGGNDPVDPAEPPPGGSLTGSPMGVNLSDVQYYSAEWPFKDFFHTSMVWRDGSWNPSVNVNLNSEGYPLLNPGQSAVSLLCRDIGGAYPTGAWVLLYDGSGTVSVGGDAQTTGSTAGRITFQVTNPTNEGIHVWINATNNANPVRNIRVMQAEFESNYMTQPFHPTFLDRLQHFSVLRFMDWMKTNNSNIQNWSDRPKVNYATYGAKGVPVEVMVNLCNTLHASPWFCMPHLATDDYVTQFATYVRDHLDPTIPVYVELSNECWNTMFQQYNYFQAQGLAQGMSSEPYLACLYAYSKRAVRVMDIWANVFQGQSDRLVRTLAGHAENPWANEQIMSYQNAYQHADAMAVAPYFGGYLGNSSSTVNMTVQQILDAAQANIAVQKNYSQQNRNAATQRGLRLVAYEGGQHLVGVGNNVGNSTLADKFMQANRDARMGQLYLQDMQNWKDVGGDVFVTYAFCGRYSQWGSWGLIERQNQNLSTAPKFQAIVQFVQQHLASQGGN